jgi:hypothetical protein
MANHIGPDLLQWDAIKNALPWSGILLGNGASRFVWDRFGYNTLFEVACSNEIENPLSVTDQALFTALDNTVNFEAVLGALSIAAKVTHVLGNDTVVITRHYDSIKRSLIEAVHAVHVRWEDIDEAALIAIRNALLFYRHVYTTNYDLLVYWAIMAENDGGGFKDYFWGEEFDVANTEIWGKVTTVLYLHGALHLYSLIHGGTVKERAGGMNLLDRFALRNDALPLFVSEGTYRDKVASIARSNYLTFALQRFSTHSGPLVIFGQGLSETDRHLVAAIRSWDYRPIAISVYRVDDQQVIEEKARLIQQFPRADIHFFDARTHPLGFAGLRVP